MQRPKGMAFIFLLLIILMSCGYRLTGRGEKFNDIQTLAISLFSNKTSERELEREMTGAIREELLTDGRVKLVSQGDADAILLGTIESYLLKPLIFDSADRVLQYRLEITASIKVEDRLRQKVFLNQSLKISQEYSLSGRVASDESARKEALKIVSRKLAQEITSLLIEGF
ncbi:MAG: LptE family protein [Candidatus Tectomicrobia bacterium]|nr:LptE family protein [Candidatus Tectomicrobia bacterium]